MNKKTEFNHWVPALLSHAVSASKASAHLYVFGSLEAHPCAVSFAMPHRSSIRNGQSESRRWIQQQLILAVAGFACGGLKLDILGLVTFHQHRAISSMPREASGSVVSPDAQLTHIRHYLNPIWSVDQDMLPLSSLRPQNVVATLGHTVKVVVDRRTHTIFRLRRLHISMPCGTCMYCFFLG